MKSKALLVIASALILAHTMHGQSPPQRWLFDTGRTYQNAGTQPAVGYDGTVYFSCSDGALYAINPNGTRRWAFTQAGGQGYSPAIGIDGTIYFASWNSNLCAVTPEGTLKWKFTTKNWNATTPAIAPDGTIYFASWDGNLYALYPDGTEKWEYLIGSSQTPATVGKDGTVYVGTGNYLFALTAGGSKIWQYNCGNVGSAASVDTNGVIYFTAQQSGNYLFALYPTGSLKWTYPLGGASLAQSAPAIDTSGNIYVSQNSTVFCIRSNGTAAWTVPLNVADASSPAICDDGTIIVGGYSSYYGLNPDGSTKWQFPIEEACISGATIAPNGDLMFGSAQRVYCLAGGVTPADSPWPMYQKASTHVGRYDLGVVGPPVISLQPISQTVILNSSVYFYAAAGGTAPLSFQWYKDSTVVLGATNSILRMQYVTLADSGAYTLLISNSVGTVSTIPANLVVTPGMQVDIYAGITVQGLVGANCQIQYCYDLSNTNNWTILTNFTLPTSPYFWLDPTPARFQRRFYRAFLTP